MNTPQIAQFLASSNAAVLRDSMPADGVALVVVLVQDPCGGLAVSAAAVRRNGEAPFNDDRLQAMADDAIIFAGNRLKEQRSADSLSPTCN